MSSNADAIEVRDLVRAPLLTIRQPWAGLIASGTRPIEIRSRAIRYRGPMWVHSAIGPAHPDKVPAGGPQHVRGAVLGLVHVVDCVPAADYPDPQWSEPHGFAWVLERARLIEPVPARGRLAFWYADLTLAAQLADALTA